MISLLQKINSSQEILLHPIHEKVLIFEGFVGFMYPFFVGTHFDKVSFSSLSQKYFTFGKIVGTFDKITSSFLSLVKSNTSLLKTIRDAQRSLPYLSLNYPDLLLLMKQALDIFKQNYDGSLFRTQLIHTDLHFGNVLYSKMTGKYLIIDIDGLESDILVKEISVILSHFITSSSLKNKKILYLLKGYESVFPLTPKEKSCIPLFMISRKVGEVVWMISQYRKNKISKKELDFFLYNISFKQLRVLTSHYEELFVFFKKL